MPVDDIDAKVYHNIDESNLLSMNQQLQDSLNYTLHDLSSFILESASKNE
jgi:hypothetical protein